MNKQIWEMYKETRRGKEVIALFELFNYEEDEFVENLEKIAKRFIDEVDIEEYINYVFLVRDNIYHFDLRLKDNEDERDFFKRFIDNFQIYWLDEDDKGNIIEGELLLKKKQFRRMCNMMDAISMNLFMMSDCFYPIFNTEDFDVFLKNCDVLGISLPEMPNSQDKKGRLMYYWKLCKSLKEFEEENNLSPEECCACIYDFALLLQDDRNIKTEIPEPTNIWFTGGSDEDYKTTLQNSTRETVAMWACNEETKRGDIVVLYCLAPQSYIHSIWIAEIDGVANPFNYYYGRTKVTKPIKITPIHISDLKRDNYWSRVPIVRKNLQGINGVKLSAQDYDELLRILKEKKFDTSVLPKLYSPNLDLTRNIKKEMDVEEKLLIPLLKELGYKEEDWTRQLSQKAGRGLKAIPDFVFFPKGEKHFQNAPMVIEAKYHIRSSNEKMNAFNQALSYCKMMSATYLGLCDKERLIIYKKENGLFDRFNPIYEKHWGSIKENVHFSDLKRIIGKDIIKKIRC